MLAHQEITDCLSKHAEAIKRAHLRELFIKDKHRFDRFSLMINDLLFDFSKNRIIDKTLPLLFKLADVCKLTDKIDQLFSGGKVNITENRPALHPALRHQNSSTLIVDGANITRAVNEALDEMTAIVQKLHDKAWLGFSGKPITDVVNIGIGGSDLGPVMTTFALTPYHLNKLTLHFISNIDDSAFWETTRHLCPETTLFIVASKSFTTRETLCNATTAKKWLLKACGDESKLTMHFIAITAKFEKAKAWGIQTILPIWDWVGGRFSLWSAIGLPIALAIGMDNFKSLLKGANLVDQNFREANFENNLPVILALLNIWYINFFNVHSYAILPYDQYLLHLPAYLQQLEMESNGKCRRLSGEKINYSTSPVVWGMVGSNSQHAFHQLLHQGTELIPIDFILPLTSHHPIGDHHTWLVANCLSQSQALMYGKNEQEVRSELTRQGLSQLQIETLLPHQILMGNRPSNTIIIPKLTPFFLGALIALYEHKVFVQSVIWDINCFDQWGVELGKQLTQGIYEQLTAVENLSTIYDSSTHGLINNYKKLLNSDT